MQSPLLLPAKCSLNMLTMLKHHKSPVTTSCFKRKDGVNWTQVNTWPLFFCDSKSRGRHQDMDRLQLPNGPRIPWLLLPFQDGLLIIDDRDLLLGFLAGLTIISLEVGQLAPVSYQGVFNRASSCPVQPVWLCCWNAKVWEINVLDVHHHKSQRHHWCWKRVHHQGWDGTGPALVFMSHWKCA